MILAVFFSIGYSIVTIWLVSLITGALVNDDAPGKLVNVSVFVLAILCSFIFTFMSQWLVAKLNAEIAFNIRTRLSQNIINTSYESIEQLVRGIN